jgi:hypothetical protein
MNPSQVLYESAEGFYSMNPSEAPVPAVALNELALQDRICPAVHPEHDCLQFGVLPQRFRAVFATESTPLAAAEWNF